VTTAALMAWIAAPRVDQTGVATPSRMALVDFNSVNPSGAGVFGRSWGCGVVGQHRACAFIVDGGLRFSDAGDGVNAFTEFAIVTQGRTLHPVDCHTDANGFCTVVM